MYVKYIKETKPLYDFCSNKTAVTTVISKEGTDCFRSDCAVAMC